MKTLKKIDKATNITKKSILKKPKKGIKKLSAERAILSDAKNYRLVSEGETGYFKKEYQKEKKAFLGGYNL